MNNFEFRVGQSVYYPRATQKLLVLSEDDCKNSDKFFKVDLGRQTNMPTTFFEDGRHSHECQIPDILPATDEVYQMLCKLYPNLYWQKPMQKPMSKLSALHVIAEFFDNIRELVNILKH